ncbi:MAG TPA: MarR family transcriptional regulator [Stackebrandtia sp.]|uniref:MarR family winged helix-turn-helix transcriptional regulator n=1 Tax=Stackebrandtia sp. TaxID=2023065 RepID=UPI002D43F6F6|nr:MarR family transcriptional regulator [Stackebrandtia sp.]HZE38681.1 MarR family transcriptional regulator [Stackebrandtia sp.]
MANDEVDGRWRTRLGYLLKHAQLRMAELNAQALRPYGIAARELPILFILDELGAASQQEAATRLGVDRTSMVALLDALEDKGLVSRRPHATDRRRNVVVLTESGADIMARAARASDAAEREFLAPLDADDANRLRRALGAVAHPPDAD